MPTYEYRCPQGHLFELFQRMSEEPRAACPECGEDSERLLSGGAGFLFKGDGFYITDYRSDSYKKEASKEESGGLAQTAAEKSSEKDSKASSTPAKTKTDSKPSSSSEGS